MKSILKEVQGQVIKLRKSGLSHRQIAQKLKLGLGTVFHYSKRIRLTKTQHLYLKLQTYKKGISQLSEIERKAASRKGGLNAPSKFKRKNTKKQIIQFIKTFYATNGRIPYKKEATYYKASRNRFGTWNNAIKAAGYDPNPVRFANKYIANDGHRCDSLAEKIIDDWLYAKNIPHETKVPYYQNRMTADFKVNDYLIEFFGLKGQVKSYDRLVKEKEKLWKKRKLKAIAIYPEDLFPKSRLEKVFASLMK
jgi:transposase